MSVYKILRAGDPTLRQSSKPVSNLDRKIEKLIADLGETLRVQKDPVGVGLAAPQVGKLFRLFIVKSGKNISTFINPEILWMSKKTNDPAEPTKKLTADNRKLKTDNRETESEKEYLMEGCLSLPYYYGPVRRALKIKVKYQYPTTNYQLLTTERIFRGLSAQIIQHEVDHLNGILFIDRLLEQKRKLYEQKGKEWAEVGLP